MADLHRARRRADDFARLVDGGATHSPGTHSPGTADDAELTESLAIVARLRAAGAVTPRAGFSEQLREQLLEAAGPVLAAVTDPDATDPDVTDPDATDPGSTDPEEVDPKQARRAKRRRRGRVVAGVSALAVLGGGIGTAAAAQQAVPGDSLYSMKRGIERVSTGVSVSDDSRGRRELAHALTRLGEVEKLVDAGRDSSRINSTLGDFTSQSRDGSSHLMSSYERTFDASDVDRVYVFIEEARSTLTTVAPKVPAASRQPVAEALNTLSQISARASRLCPVCLVPASKTTAVPAPSDSDPTTPTGSSKDPSVPPVPDTPLKPVPTVSVPMPGTGEQTAPPPAREPGSPQVPDPVVPTVPPTKPSLPTLPKPSGPPTVPSLPLPSLPLPSITLPGVTIPGLPPLVPPITVGLPPRGTR